jgi:hypothetical protein
MLANMAISLIMHKRITTTLAKAKELKKYVEPLITKAKEDSTNSRRVVFSYLQNKELQPCSKEPTVAIVGELPIEEVKRDDEDFALLEYPPLSCSCGLSIPCSEALPLNFDFITFCDALRNRVAAYFSRDSIFKRI